MHRQQDAAEHLLLRDHVADERTTVAARAHRAGAGGIDGAVVVSKARVTEVEATLAGERRAHTAGTRRQHAVKHVDAHAHAAHERSRVADAHQVARLVLGHVLGSQRRQRLEHGLVVLAHRVAADAVAGEVAALLQVAQRAQAQVQVHAALDDAKKCLVIAGMRLVAALGPHARQLHGALDILARGGIAGALVELHADVGTELHGDFHVVLGRPEHVAAVVVVDDKTHALVGELDSIVVAEHLEAARVGEDGAVPVHKLVQSAQLGDGVLAGTHGQVVSVGEHDLCTELLDGLGGNALDVCLGAHGHKDRRLDVAVRGVQHAGARMRRRVLGDQVEFKEVLVHKLGLLGCGSYADHYTGNQRGAPTRQKPVFNAPGHNERGFSDTYITRVDNLPLLPKTQTKNGRFSTLILRLVIGDVLKRLVKQERPQ